MIEFLIIFNKIYFKIVRQYLNIYGIASNTVKQDNNDKIGTYSEETIFRFHKNIDQIKIYRFPRFYVIPLMRT